MRLGDFSSISTALIDPATGLPLAGNQIPASRINAASLALLRFIPLPNLDGTSRNFHYVTTNASTADNVNLRVTHNFTPNAGGRGVAGGRGGGGGGRGGFGGPAGGGARGRGQQGTSVTMTAQLQYRRNDNDQNNVFPTLGGQSTGSSFTLPVTLNIQRRRTCTT